MSEKHNLGHDCDRKVTEVPSIEIAGKLSPEIVTNLLARKQVTTLPRVIYHQRDSPRKQTKERLHLVLNTKKWDIHNIWVETLWKLRCWEKLKREDYVLSGYIMKYQKSQ